MPIFLKNKPLGTRLRMESQEIILVKALTYIPIASYVVVDFVANTCYPTSSGDPKRNGAATESVEKESPIEIAIFALY